MTQWATSQWRKLGTGARWCIIAVALFSTILLSLYSWSQSESRTKTTPGLEQSGLDEEKRKALSALLSPQNPETGVKDEDTSATPSAIAEIPDDDLDGWDNAFDEDDQSRAVVRWEKDAFANGEYRQPKPRWFIGPAVAGGRLDASAWHSTATPEKPQFLFLYLPPRKLRDDFQMDILGEQSDGAVLYASIVDAKNQPLPPGEPVNVLNGNPAGKIDLTVSLPWSTYRDAHAIMLWTDQPGVSVARTSLYVDEDGDGLDKAQEKQLGISDRNPDSDNDGIPDIWERKYGLNPADKSDGKADADRDGISNREAYELGIDPRYAISRQGGRAGTLQVEVWHKRSSKKDPSEVLYASETVLPEKLVGADDYQARFRGYIIPPKTGDYTFHLSADDYADVWLSQNDSPFNRQRIVQLRVPAPFSVFNKFGTQGSVPITLEAGKRYFLEMTFKERAKNEHLQFGWTLPGSTNIQTITSASLHSFIYDPADSNMNGLPDAWERKNAKPGSPPPKDDSFVQLDPLADPDNDLLMNLEEYQQGSDPHAHQAGSPLKGMFAVDMWENIEGKSIAELLNASPTTRLRTGWQIGFEHRWDRGDRFVMRLKGVLTPPQSGEYRFWISSDDASELYLSSNTSPADRRLIAHQDDYTELRQFDRYSYQGSASLQLQGGKPLYMEILFKEGTKDDHLSIAWQSPTTAAGELEIIPTEFLRAAVPDRGDLDADGLPDNWERKTGLHPKRGLVGDPKEGSLGDWDGDGIRNHDEYLAGSNPRKAESVPDLLGSIEVGCWTNIPGRKIADLLDAETFCSTPDDQFYLSSTFYQRNADNYGTRMRGILLPTLRGEYTFWISGDDHCELWLGRDDTPFTRRRIAFHRTATAADQLDKQPWQKSVPVFLEPGDGYYLEILHKEETGRDLIAVHWQVPGYESPERISRRYLKTPAQLSNDRDDDGLPDDWEARLGLDPSDNGRKNPGDGSFRDPDGDGLCNLEECQYNTDPLVYLDQEGVTGLLTVDLWRDGNTVRRVQEFLDRPPRPPDLTCYCPGIEPMPEDGFRYFRRIRGTLVAPATGEYTFWISSDNEGELWLSPNARRFDRRLIASADHFVRPREFTKQSQQQSAPISLKKGEAYFIEILHKQGDGNDHLSVAWQTPESDQPELIPPEVLRSLRADPDDLDDDGLMDEWEAANNLRLEPLLVSGNDAGSLGDADGDGLRNHEEYLYDLDPNLAADGDGLPGFLLYERWNNIPGSLLPDLYDSGALGRAPDRIQYLRSAEMIPRQGDNYGGRLRGLLRPPVTGEYTFWLAGDDETELWLSSDARPFDRKLVAWIKPWSKFRQWDRHPSQESDPIRLLAGRSYYLEVVHKEGLGNDHAAVAWKIPLTDGQLAINADPDAKEKIPENQRELITSRYLVSFVPDPDDQDQDGFVDSWEAENGLDPTRYNPPSGDADEDGLTDFEEWQWGTAANLADSDGDGVSDFDEINVLETDALLDDIDPFVLLQSLAGTAGVGSSGEWSDQGNRLIQQSPDGTAAFTVHVQTAGIFLVEVDLSMVSPGPSDSWDIEILVNGQSIRRADQQIVPDETSTIKGLTPWLKRGAHEIQIRVHNVYVTRRIAIDAVRLLRPAGTDKDGNGIPDWVDERIAGNNPVSVIEESAINPLFIEGRTRWLSACTNHQKIAMFGAPNQGFFLNLPLRSNRDTRLDLSLENGAVQHHLNVSWTPFNLLYEADTFVRVGDAIRVTVAPEESTTGTMRLGIGDKQVTRPWNRPELVHFKQPGDTILTGIYQGSDHSATGAIRITAVQADLGEPPVLIAGKTRRWDFPNFNGPAELELDDNLQRSPITATESGQQIYLLSEKPGTVYAATRIVGNGAILDAIPIETISFHKGDDTGVRYIEFYEDGSQLVEMPIHISNMTPDMRVELDIFVAGVIFENGSTRMVLTAADFDSNGWARVRFLRPGWVTASVCHRTRIYQGDQQIAYFR